MPEPAPLSRFDVVLEVLGLLVVLLLFIVGLTLSGCGDDSAPPAPDGGVTASHPGERPPTTCAPGWHPIAGGCELDVDAAVGP